MKNKIKFGIVFLLAVILHTSCMPKLTEIWVHDDESGKIEMSFDMGEMIDVVGSMMSEGEGEDSWGNEESIDSTINFYNILTDSLKNNMQNAELLKQINLSIHMNATEKIAMATLDLSYENQDEIESILRALKESNKSQGAGVGAMLEDENIDEIFGNYTIDYDNGIYRFPVMDLQSEMEKDPELEAILKGVDSVDSISSEEKEFIQMFFGFNTITRIHLPGQIIFTNDRKAKIDGNTIEFEDNLLKSLDSENPLRERIIKFKSN